MRYCVCVQKRKCVTPVVTGYSPGYSPVVTDYSLDVNG